MKLQELLNNYKDELRKGDNSYAILFYEEENIIDYIYYQEDGTQINIKKPLSDLLFSTPFLSLLEWKMENYLRCKLIVDDVVIDGQGQPHDRNTTRQFDSKTIHKINLVLLNTDEERISYLENNTI